MTESHASETPTVIVTGTPDAPAFKRRPLLFVASLLVYAIWLTLLIVWAVELHRGR